MPGLAADPRSQTFAVAVPSLRASRNRSKASLASELAIFSPDQSQPLFIEEFPHRITALMPVTGSSGFMVVDAAAQIRSLARATDTTPFAQSLANLNLNMVEPSDKQQQDKAEMLSAGDEADSDDDDDLASDVEATDNEDYDILEAVIAPQRLTDIFDAAPAFAMPPIEELFYQVAGLFSLKPLGEAASA